MAKVKSITTFHQSDQTNNEPVKRSYEERDDQENVVLLIHYYFDGSQEMKIERTYDEENRLLEEKQFSTEEEPNEVHTFEYTASGKLQRQSIQYRDGSFSYRNHEYDEANNSEKIMIVDDEGEEEGNEFRRFNSEGKALEEVVYGDFGLEVKRESEYDDHGHLIKQTTEDNEGYIVDHFYQYERDEQQKLTHLKVIDDEGTLVKNVAYIYDQKDRVIEQHIKDSDRGWAFILKWEYDEKDRIVEERRSDFSGKVLEITKVTFDENDFVIEQEKTSTHGVEVNAYEYAFF